MKQVVIEEKKQTVSLDNLDVLNIYATRIGSIIYKAIHINSNYMFYPVSETLEYCVSPYKTLRELIEIWAKLGYTVYEFDNLKEFAEWLVKETK